MDPSLSAGKRLRTSLLLASLFSLLAACGPKSPFYQADENRDAPGPNVSFQMPADGTTVAEPTELAATGGGIFRVDFEVDSQPAHIALSPPFAWTLDPRQFVIGPNFSYRVRVRVFTDRGEARRSVDLSFDRSVSNDSVQASIEALAPGEWYEVPHSRLAQIAWIDFDTYGNFRDVIGAASGGAYDTERDRLIVFGGGESYAGNEIYAFELDESRWVRLTDPSERAADDPENLQRASLYPDGRPVSRHTYDTLEYLPPPVDRFFVSHAGALYSSFWSDRLTHYFDFDAGQWESAVAEHEVTVGFGGVTALAPDGRVWMHGGGGSANEALEIYDPATRTWTRHAEFEGQAIGLKATAEIDPGNMLFLVTGMNATYQWDLRDPDAQATRLVTSGATEIEGTTNPGFAFHPPSGRLFAWAGGRSVYSLDVASATWNRHDPAGTVDPGDAAARGTYGRWRYVPSRDIFIVVNDVYRNVFVYRPPELP